MLCNTVAASSTRNFQRANSGDESWLMQHDTVPPSYDIS